jgi:hypothetical protein
MIDTDFNRRDTAATVRVRPALRVGLLIVYCLVLILIALSMIGVFQTIADIIRDLDKGNQILLLAALAAALVPSAGMLVWAYKAIVAAAHAAANSRHSASSTAVLLFEASGRGRKK